MQLSNEKPEKIISLGNGYYYYNYIVRETEDGSYEVITVKTAGKPDYKTCVELIIREYISSSEEFDLINSMNESEEDMIKYQNWLTLRKQIKNKIKQDFA